MQGSSSINTKTQNRIYLILFISFGPCGTLYAKVTKAFL